MRVSRDAKYDGRGSEMNKNILAAVAVMVISVVLLVVSLIRPDPEIPEELTLSPSDPPVQPSGPEWLW